MDDISSIFKLFDRQWALVTAGTEESFNTMTISWGGLGTLWNKPVATVYVRPSRYTHEFMEREPLFTVSFYGEEFRRDLGVLGSRSGRDCGKVGMTKLTPKAVETALGQGMTFAEAELTLVCRKIFRQDIEKSLMDADIAAEHYAPEEPAHTMYVGEVIELIRR